jgi:hypothetical protein
MAKTLPFLVYAAREGYGWVNAGAAPLALLEQFRRAAGKMPDFDIRDAGTSGVVNVGEWALVYRFMRQVGGDSRGRDCAYLALSYFNANEAGEINADALLMDPAFKVPQKTPPDTIGYTGGKGAKREWQVPNQSGRGVFDSSGSLSAACAAVGGATGGMLRISRCEPDDGRGSRFDYVTTPVAAARNERVEAVSTADKEAAVPEATARPVCRVAHGCPWRTVVLLAILAFLAGCWMGMRVDLWMGRMLP